MTNSYQPTGNIQRILYEYLMRGCCNSGDSYDKDDFSDRQMGRYPTEETNIFPFWKVIFDTNVGEIEIKIAANSQSDAITTATMDIHHRDKIDWWKVKSAKMIK